jgi:hypothetical protein
LFDNDDGNRITLGLNGVSVFYAAAEGLSVNVDDTYTIFKKDFDDEFAIPKKDDLIINGDGRFLRVNYYAEQGDNSHVNCTLIAVSGTGGGGGGSSSGGGTTVNPKDIEVIYDNYSKAFLYGTSFNIGLTATTKAPNTATLDISWSVIDAEGRTIDSGSKTAANGSHTVLEDVGRKIEADGSFYKIIISISGGNANAYSWPITKIKCVNLKIERNTDSFPEASVQRSSSFYAYFNAYGDIAKNLCYSIDGV